MYNKTINMYTHLQTLRTENSIFLILNLIIYSIEMMINLFVLEFLVESGKLEP